MTLRTAAAALVGLLVLAAPWTPVRGEGAPRYRGLPPLSDQGLPPLPERSPRNANYTMEARLDDDKHRLDASLVLEWRNTTGQPQSTFPFHLYWNAFRNNLSTAGQAGGRRAFRVGQGDDRTFGYVDVKSVQRLSPEEDLKPSMRYVAPDDGNRDDRTVMEVTTAQPVAPGDTVRFRIEWTALIPYGNSGRAGWVHDYNFIVQWFPKIGVFWKGQWNAHQFHPTTEFFADYGVYDVRLTVPRGNVTGATGRLEERRENADGTETLRFVQEDVHDFAWCTSRRFLERTSRFDDPGYPPVDIRLLLQPEHAHLAERYLEATKTCLRYYGAWSAPYPYKQVTVVDPAWISASGGMEYPTLFTGGANVFAPPVMQSPEGVTIHEAGHQFWYGLVGNNEFEEAWLDEGFNSYHNRKAQFLALGPHGWSRRYFGFSAGRGARTGYPVVAPDVLVGRGREDLPGLRENGQTDVMVRKGWEYRNAASYGINSYGKPALVLQTLEGLVGDETMTRIMRTYARRYRFAHPTTSDFIATVKEVTGQDYGWFFDETFFSSELCDYAVSVEVEPVKRLEGYAEGPDGQLKMTRSTKRKKDTGPWESRVTVQRLGGVRLPVELLVAFADGKTVRETWDGKDRWKRFTYTGDAKVTLARLDPSDKIALDVDPSNNEWVAETGYAERAASKWAARFMFWIQNLLELHTFLG